MVRWRVYLYVHRITLLRYADKRIVNIMEVNIFLSKGMTCNYNTYDAVKILTLFTFNFVKRRIRPPRGITGRFKH